MIVARCPSCGAPTPVSLAEPNRIRCRHCGYDGLPDPSTGQAMLEASAAARAMTDKERRLGGLERKLVSTNIMPLAILYGIITLALSLPILLFSGSFALFHLLDGSLDDWPLRLGLPLVSLGLIAIFLFGGLFALSVAISRVRASVAAIPPEKDGTPSLCRFCGADLPPSRDNIIVKCAFCGTENLIPDQKLRKLYHRHEIAIKEAHRNLLRQNQRASRFSYVVLVVGVLGIIFTPVISCSSGIAMELVAESIELDTFEGVEYAWVPVGGRKFLARVDKTSSGLVVDFEKNGPLSMPNRLAIAQSEKLETFPIQRLEGQQVITLGNHLTRVTKALRLVSSPEHDQLRGTRDDGEEVTWRAAGTCKYESDLPHVVSLRDSRTSPPKPFHLLRNFYSIDGRLIAVDSDDVFAISKSDRTTQKIDSLQEYIELLSILDGGSGIYIGATVRKKGERRDETYDEDCALWKKDLADNSAKELQCNILPKTLVQNSKYVFFASTDSIWIVPRGSTKIRKFGSLHDDWDIASLAASKNGLYFFVSGGSHVEASATIYSTPVDHWHLRPLALNVKANSDSRLVLAGGVLYWLGAKDRLYSIPVSGGKPVIVDRYTPVATLAGNSHLVCISKQVKGDFPPVFQLGCFPAGDRNTKRLRIVAPASEGWNIEMDEHHLYWKTKQSIRMLRVP